MGIGNHQSGKSLKDEWLTPPEIIEALGPFDLDPCAPAIRPWETAAHYYTINENGLEHPWHDCERVWLNPPYGKETSKWLARLAYHGNGIALIFARTETDMFFKQVWSKASALLFLRGRLHFHHIDGKRAQANAGGPSVLIAYGDENIQSLMNSGLDGFLVIPNTEYTGEACPVGTGAQYRDNQGFFDVPG